MPNVDHRPFIFKRDASPVPAPAPSPEAEADAEADAALLLVSDLLVERAKSSLDLRIAAILCLTLDRPLSSDGGAGDMRSNGAEEEGGQSDDRT